MKLKKGKYYRIANGDVAYVGHKSPNKDSKFPWIGEELRYGNLRSWSDSGSYLIFNKSRNDLVEEIEDRDIINKALEEGNINNWVDKTRDGKGV